MAKLEIITGADSPPLRTPTKKISQVTKEHLKLLKDMKETVDGVGVGIAAPQIGHSLRICIAQINEKFTPLISPEITWRSEETDVLEEGCLSLPDVTVNVLRSLSIILKYFDEKNEEQERKLEGWNARVVQHEVDHLDGKLIVDYR